MKCLDVLEGCVEYNRPVKRKVPKKRYPGKGRYPKKRKPWDKNGWHRVPDPEPDEDCTWNPWDDVDK